MKKLITIVLFVIILITVTIVPTTCLAEESNIIEGSGIIGDNNSLRIGGRDKYVDKSRDNSVTRNSNNITNVTNDNGTSNKINITDNSTYTEQLTPTDLLNSNSYVPLADRLLDKDMYISKSIFKLQRYGYTCKELTRFANPGRFLAILWPEWDNKYSIEVATFAKYSAKKRISVLPMAAVSTMGLIKIGEGSASAKDLNKSEHQVMAALAVRSAEAGATVVVFKGFSRPLVKVDSFVIGGGGVQAGSPQSVFNGAAGIGSSSSETVTRACIIAELYR